MGCDIHLYFEQKNRFGKWERINFPESIEPDDRNYTLFSFLADVRNYWGKVGNEKITPQFANRGVPKDSSVDQDFYECSDHSITHAYLDEILAAPWGKYGLDECYFKMFCKYVIPHLCSFCGILSKEEEKNIRVIMGFDN